MTQDTEQENKLTDNQLVADCLNGDEAAWTQLIKRYQRLIYSVARAICPDPDDTNDVFQYTCLDLYRGLGELRDIKALPAWLITVTRRRAFSVVKAKVPAESADDETSRSVTEDVIRIVEYEHAIERALEQLPGRCRDLIDLLYFNASQPSYNEISQRTGIPVPSIGPTRARCLDKLRKLLI
jgi:RNA polymerase sigma factor (sigma-70 family)